MLTTNGLTKRYGSLTALDGLTLSVEPGETFGLLGPNGAGKTTTLRLMAGLTDPTEGTVRVAGRDPWPEPSFTNRSYSSWMSRPQGLTPPPPRAFIS